MRFAPRWLGALLLLAEAALAVDKSNRGVLPEMLWGCHPAAIILGLGVLFRVPLMAQMGSLFHISIGILGYAIDLATMRTTTIPSFAVHVLGPLTGFIQIRRGGLRPAALIMAIAYYFVLVVACRLFTPPSLNVNVVFSPYLSVEFYSRHPTLLPIVNALQMIGLLGGGYLILTRTIGRATKAA